MGINWTKFADLLGMAQYGDDVRAVHEKKRKEAIEDEDQAFRRTQRGWLESDRPADVERRRKADERGDYQFGRTQVEDTRQDTTFGQGQEDRTVKLREREQEKQRAREYAKKNFPGMNVDFIESMDDLKAMIAADQGRAQIKASEALAGLRGAQTEAGGFRPATGKKPTWTDANEARLNDQKLKLRNAVLNGVIKAEEAEAAWQQIQEQADRQKQAALEAEQAAIVTPGGVDVDAESLPGGSSPQWQGMPYRLDRSR